MMLLLDPQARKSFANSSFYWAILLLLSLLIPHFIWLYQHDFITIRYAFATPGEYTHQHYAWQRLVYFLRYLANNLGNVIGLFILLWPFYLAPKDKLNLSRSDRHFLLLLGLGPVALSLLLCIASGSHFPPRWSTPYFSLLGLLTLAWLKPQYDAKRLQRFILTLVVLGFSLWAAKMSSFIWFDHRLKADSYQPNRQMAESLTTLWHQRFHRPLRYIAGSRYLVAALVAYSPDRPKPYFDWSQQESPWIDEQELIKQGALVVWDEDQAYTWDAESQQNTQLTTTVLQRFPQLKVLGIYRFNKLTNQPSTLSIGVAILPPSNLKEPG